MSTPNVLDSESAFSNISWYWGILAESTLTKGQREFQVYVPDLTPLRNGDVTNKGSMNNIELFNVMSQSWEKKEVHLSKTITAEYLGFESSREVPDMYKGQQVLVMTYGCNDRWFWIPLERDDYVKPFEHVKVRCADIALIHKLGEPMPEDEARKVYLHDDNTYFMEIDTKYKKHIFLSTAGTDGEKYRYFMKFDAKEHTVEIWDGLVNPADKLFGKCLDVPHNSIKIESDPVYSQGNILKGRITLQNEAGTTIILEGRDMKINVPRDLTINVGRNVVTTIQGDHGKTVAGNEEVKIIGYLKKWVQGFIQKEVVGVFSYLFHSDRNEDVRMNYTRDVKMNVTEDVGINHTVTTKATYTYKAPIVLIQGSAKASYLGKQTIISCGSSLSFVAGSMNTTTHIYGCCGCLGH